MIFVFIRRKNLLAGLMMGVFLFSAGSISLFADEIKEPASTEQSQVKPLKRAQPAPGETAKEKKRGETVAKPTLGDKVLEESDKHREAEANLLLLTEKKMRFFKERINDFLEEQHNKEEAKRLYKIGVKLFEQKEYTKARAEFEKAVSFYPEHKNSKSYMRKIDKIKGKLELRQKRK